MKRLSKVEVMAKNQRKVKEFDVEEWEGSVVIRSLKSNEVMRLQKYIVDGQPNDVEYYFELIAYSLVDENMQPSYTVKEVHEFDMPVLNKIMLEISELNGMSKDAVDEAREALKKALSDSSVSN